MSTKIAVAAIVLMAVFTTPAQNLIDRFQHEAAGMPSLPASQQQIEQSIEQQMFGDFDTMLAGIQ